jgi:hypothetical protein
MSNVLSFRIEPLAGAQSVLPLIDGASLAVLVNSFETQHDYGPTGAYRGFIPSYFSYGPLEPYFLGEAASGYWASIGGIYLLGCKCGDVGCWPLVARVTVSGEDVTWSNFAQPHRPARDYSGFGPFVFDKRSYLAAVRAVAAELGSA